MCVVTNVLISWMDRILSQCVPISNYHKVHLKYLTILFVNIKSWPKKKKNFLLVWKEAMGWDKHTLALECLLEKHRLLPNQGILYDCRRLFFKGLSSTWEKIQMPDSPLTPEGLCHHRYLDGRSQALEDGLVGVRYQPEKGTSACTLRLLWGPAHVNPGHWPQNSPGKSRNCRDPSTKITWVQLQPCWEGTGD